MPFPRRALRPTSDPSSVEFLALDRFDNGAPRSSLIHYRLTHLTLTHVYAEVPEDLSIYRRTHASCDDTWHTGQSHAEEL
jgi:hypothetical protein